MNVRMIRSWIGLVLVGGLVVGPLNGMAQNGAAVSDAQVESNVLRALAGAPELSTQNVQSATVYGTVTLTGNVHDEALRTKAENLVARAQGVKKVVDELTLGDTPATAANADTSVLPDQQSQDAAAMGQQPDSAQANAPVLQSDGTYAPAPDGSGVQPQQPMYAQNGQDGAPSQPGYPGASQAGYGQPGFGQAGPPPSGRQPMSQEYTASDSVPGGQRAGLPVTIPAGSMLRIRINRLTAPCLPMWSLAARLPSRAERRFRALSSMRRWRVSSRAGASWRYRSRT
jgi:hypothetical protein